MRSGALCVGVLLACDARTPGAASPAPREVVVVEAPAAVVEPAAPVVEVVAPGPEPERTKVVVIEPWGLEITLPEHAGHVFDPGNKWFHAEPEWEQSVYVKKIAGPQPASLRQIPREWKLGDELKVLEEKLLPDGSLSCAYSFEAMVPTETGKAMMSRASQLYVTRPLDLRSHIECRVRFEFEPSEEQLAERREMCLSLRPVGR